MNSKFTNPFLRTQEGGGNDISIINLVLSLVCCCFIGQPLQAQHCTMTCDDHLNISMDNNCEILLDYRLVLEEPDNPRLCQPNGKSSYVITVMTGQEESTTIPSSPYITDDYIGQTLYVKAKHWATGNICWSTVTIEDKAMPNLTCPEDVIVHCTSSTEPEHTGYATAIDCSGYELSYEDKYEDLGCGVYAGQILRIWKATDAYGNTNTCTQNIYLKRSTINDIIFPTHKDGIYDPAVSCADGNTDPSITGYPTVNNAPLSGNDTACGFSVSYEDEEIFVCTGTYKIIRTWQVLDWCTSDIKTEVQVIKVEDNTGPTIECGTPLTFGTTSGSECIADVTIPPITVTDACSNYTNVTIKSRFGTIPNNGGNLSNVPVGIHTITYYAEDACGNISTCDRTLIIEDTAPPVVICESYRKVTLLPSGNAEVRAASFDDGSYDNCCLDKLEVKRVGEDDNAYGPTVLFTCEDTQSPVMVILRVSDCGGNTSTCMVEATIEDKAQPSIDCATEVTINCKEDYTNLNLTGQPVAFDACGAREVTYEDELFLNDCNVGYVLRTWSVNDIAGNGLTSCVQRINIIDNTPVSVNFPPDYTTSNCTSSSALTPNDLPEPFNKPIVTGDDCELMASNYKDEVLSVAAPACFKILRTWTLIDWCTYDPNNPNGQGRYEHVQIIKVIDDEAPTFTCLDEMTVDVVAANCLATVTMPDLTNIDDCSDDIEVSISGDLGTGKTFSNVAPGIYNMTYTVSDGCGNSSNCTTKVTVKDTKAPTPYCLGGITTALMQNGGVEVWAEDFDIGSIDNCTNQEDLKITIALANEEPSNDSPPVRTSLVFGCEHIGQNIVQIWVGDNDDNWSYCETIIEIQDPSTSCGGAAGSAIIAGRIQNELGETIEGVQVGVSGAAMEPITTRYNGEFQFDDLEVGKDYTIIPVKETAYHNGVSTYDQVLIMRHILGTETLNSPYKWIAADIDRNGRITTHDMVDMRKVILRISDRFTYNTSWRFIKQAYQFTNPQAPLEEEIEEFYNINNLNQNEMYTNFLAIKVGDVSGDALPSDAVAVQERNDNPLAIWTTPEQTLTAGQLYKMPVYATPHTAITGFQFTLNFDAHTLEYEDVEAANLPITGQNIGQNINTNGFITASWASAHTIEATDEPLFYVIFNVKKNTSISKSVQLSSALTKAEMYNENLTVQDLTLEVIPETTNLITLQGNQPNPFTQHTNIAFYINEQSDVQLTIYDLTGRSVYALNNNFNKGYNNFTIQQSDLPYAGTYLYELNVGGIVVTSKLVKL